MGTGYTKLQVEGSFQVLYSITYYQDGVPTWGLFPVRVLSWPLPISLETPKIAAGVRVCLENDMKRFIAGIGSHNYGVGSPPVCHLQPGEPGKWVVEFLVQRPESWGASGLSQSSKVQEPRVLLSKDGIRCRESKFSLPPFLFCLDYLWIRWCPPAFVRNIYTQPLDSSAHLFGHRHIQKCSVSSLGIS